MYIQKKSKLNIYFVNLLWDLLVNGDYICGSLCGICLHIFVIWISVIIRKSYFSSHLKVHVYLKDDYKVTRCSVIKVP